MALPIIRQMSDHVFDKDKVVFVPDHFTPNKDIKSAENSKAIREYAKEQGLSWYFEQGKSGVEHAILPEAGVVTAGECIIGADSHTCTYGALGAFSTGMEQRTWLPAWPPERSGLRCPSAIKFVLTGKPGKYVSGKDIIIHIIERSAWMEPCTVPWNLRGTASHTCLWTDRLPWQIWRSKPGQRTRSSRWMKRPCLYQRAFQEAYTIYEADADAPYDEVITRGSFRSPSDRGIPHLPGNAKTIDEVEAMEPIKIDQVVIGSCTNGRMEDMRKAAAILKGHTVHRDVRVMVVPATQKIYKQCVDEVW